MTKKRTSLLKKYSVVKGKEDKPSAQKEITPMQLQQRWDKKAIQVETLAKNIQSLKYNITKDLQSDDEKTFMTACAIDLMMRTGERVGNEDSASNGHVGITGLTKKNVKIFGTTIKLQYTGKSGVAHDKAITDKRLAENLKKCIKKSNSNIIFCTSEGFCIKADKINRHLKDFNVTAKDVRGFSANKWVVDKLKNSDIPATEQERKKQFIQVVKSVAEKVGHGAATLRNQYLIPELETKYVSDGKIIEMKEMASGGEVKNMRTGGEVATLDKPTTKADYLAPNGKVSKLTNDQWHLVRTPEFKTWFGDWENAYNTGNYKGVSKGIDSNGEPMVFYHGTNRVFNEFHWHKNRDARNSKFQGNGFFFTSDPYVAYKYSEAAANQALIKDEFYDSLDRYYPKPIAQLLKYQVEMPYSKAWEKAIEEFGGREAFFKIVRNWENETNLDINTVSDFTEHVEGTLRNSDVDNSHEFVNIFASSSTPSISDYLIDEADKYHFENALPNFNVKEVFLKMDKVLKTKNGERASRAKENGFDSVIYSGAGTVSDSIEYIVYTPNQIKSADGSNTTFDTQNPDIRYKIGGAVNKVLLAPNGKVSNLNPTQYKLVRTDNFKKWFGDWENDKANSSTVVDENGEPLVVYHGTASSFFEFQVKSKRGIFFSDKFDTAKRFSEGDLKRDGESPKIFECFLNIRKPFIKNRTQDDLLVDNYFKEYFAKRSFITKKNKKSILSSKHKHFEDDLASFGIISQEGKDKIIQFGYDGIFFPADNNTTTYVCFYPNQIKSADGSNTTFDTQNPDIRYENGGEVKKYDTQLITVEPEILKVLHILNDKGHQALIVGGAVRDAILGIYPKDIDIEVYNIGYADLSNMLSAYGKINLVGKSFGVIKFKPFAGDMEYDFSVPRKENKIGIGHKSFEVSFDETMTIKDAALRRDFTFNSLAYDPITNTVYDYFGGVSDIENKIIRHTSEKFTEDALRILRAMQFQARFDFEIAPETIILIQQMLQGDDFNSLPKKRIFDEWYKWAEKGKRHDGIFKFLRDTTLIDYYPELKLLKETPQDPIYHPEGDVEIHTTLCLRFMDKILAETGIKGEEKAILVMAILFHDIAKPPTTEEKFKNGRMTITSNGHEELGGDMVKKILWDMGFHADLITPISNLVATHLAGVHISVIPEERSKVKAVKKLSKKLHPANIKQLLHVMNADHNGRGSDVYKVPTGSEDLARIAESVDITEKPYEYILMGRHLIELGLKPSPEFGKILSAANEAQINGEYSDIEGGRLWLKNYLEKQQ